MGRLAFSAFRPPLEENLVLPERLKGFVMKRCQHHKVNHHKNFQPNQRFAAIVPCLLAALWVGGCQTPPAPTIRGTEPWVSPSPMQRRSPAARSVENRPIETIVLGNGPDVILVVATIHGNEPAGTPLARMLADHLERNRGLLAGKTVVIMPVANPDGAARNTRNNARGVDLNRNFSAANRQNTAENGLSALSEPEAQAISQVLTTYRPNRIVSLHQPLSCIDYDGPGAALAQAMAKYTDLPIKKLGAKPGSLGAFAGDTLGIPTVTVEMKSKDHLLSRSALWQRYGDMLLAAIAYPQPLLQVGGK